MVPEESMLSSALQGQLQTGDVLFWHRQIPQFLQRLQLCWVGSAACGTAVTSQQQQLLPLNTEMLRIQPVWCFSLPLCPRTAVYHQETTLLPTQNDADVKAVGGVTKTWKPNPDPWHSC